MPGKIKKLIDNIIEKRSGGNPAFVGSTKVKMIMKGIFPDKYDENSLDDQAVIDKLESLAKELNINI
jgi:hypothetical protein